MTDAARAKAQKLEAITKLGIARREKLTGADFAVYLEGTEHQPADVVIEACKRLSREPKGEFESTFPTLAKVLSTCYAVNEERLRKRALMAPKRQDVPDPISPAQWEEIKAKFQEVMRGKAMR